MSLSRRWDVSLLGLGLVMKADNYIEKTSPTEVFHCVCSLSLSLSLQDTLLQHGWKTGAIIPELEDEIAQTNEQVFKENLAEVLTVENLLQKRQVSAE